MKRQQLLHLLNAYQPTPEEVAFKERMLAFVQEHEACFERSLMHGHMTASAWLLSSDEQCALLMHHAKLDKWLQLGGHCDGESDVLAVALKEAQEESGIQNIVPVGGDIFDIDIHLIPARKHEPEHYHYDVRFLLKVVGDEQVVQNSESKELRWLSKHDNATLALDRSVLRLWHKWMEHRA